MELEGIEPSSKQGNHTLSTRLFQPLIFVRQQDINLNDSMEKVAYRTFHVWSWVPINGHELYCSLCEDTYTSDTVYCLGIRNDSIYYVYNNKGDLGIDYTSFHSCKIPFDLVANPSFNYHCEVFKDSLSKDTHLCSACISHLNAVSSNEYYSELKKVAP